MHLFLKIICIYILFLTPATLANDDPQKEKTEPIDVFIKEIKTEDIYDSLVFGGFVEPNASYDIGSEILGNLHKLHVKLGQFVQKGDTLFEILPSSAGYEYQLNRVQSPIAGVISNIQKKIGNWVRQGDIIVTVTDDSLLKTTIHVTYDDLPFLNKKVPISATIGFGHESEKTAGAAIHSISPKADGITGTYPVELTLKCKGDPTTPCANTFKVGALLKVVIKKNYRKGIKVPLVYLHSQRKKVLTVDDENLARWIDITTGTYYGKDVEIVKGLDSSMRIVSSYSKKPDEGDPLKIVEEKKENEKS